MEMCILKSFRRKFFITLLLLFATPAAFAQQMEVSMVQGGTSLDFGSLHSLNPDGTPAEDIAIRQVRIQVPESLTRRYIISQTLVNNPSNQNGAALAEGVIRFRVELEFGSGFIKTGNEMPLAEGTQELYESSDTGEAATLIITYSFVVPPSQNAGRYYSSINYRLDVTG